MTPISEVYSIFLSQIDDDIIALLDQEVMENLLLIYLKSATTRFPQCTKSLKIIHEEYIEGDLELDELEILAQGMIVYWLLPKIFATDNLTTYIVDKDFNQKSPANLLSRLQQIKKDMEKDLRTKIIAYTYKDMGNGWIE